MKKLNVRKLVLLSLISALAYAIVLIVVMLCTWSPKVKDKIAVLSDSLKKFFKKKEVGTNG